MNVWLMHVGEELVVDPNARPFRYGYLADALVQRGHSVLRWAPTFQHARKHQRFNRDTFVEVGPGHNNQFVYADGYRRNVSLARFRSYRRLATRFRHLAPKHERPDIIVSGIPSLDWCDAANDFGDSINAPVVIDVRDLWPDVFLTSVPRALRPFARRALRPLYAQAERICQRATALTAVSQTYLRWGLGNARRERKTLDKVLPLGYSQQVEAASNRVERLANLREHGIDYRKTICCFFGLFEKSYDLCTVVDAARRMQQAGRCDVQFVLCGSGGQYPKLRRRARGLNNVVFMGWVDQHTLAAVMSIAEIGLAAYTADATQSLPNKPFEYMAGRLAVVSSLQGELADLLRAERCGDTYTAGDSHSLVQTIQNLLRDPASLDAKREQGHRLYVKQYSATNLAQQFAQHLETVHAQSTAHEGLAA